MENIAKQSEGNTMARRILATAALALGAVFAANGNTKAGDDTPYPSGFSGGAIKTGTASGTTMTLGGQGTAAQAAAADDTEFTRGGGGRGGGVRSCSWRSLATQPCHLHGEA